MIKDLEAANGNFADELEQTLAALNKEKETAND